MRTIEQMTQWREMLFLSIVVLRILGLSVYPPTMTTGGKRLVFSLLKSVGSENRRERKIT